MSNSKLATFTLLSPSRTNPRGHRIDTITIHTMAGNMTAENCAAMFSNPALRVSSNYAVGSDGKIALIVDEANRSWCSSNADNDHRAVTIEVASLTNKEPFACSDEAMRSLIVLCADICKRNGIPRLLWRADKGLVGQVDKQNMTAHRWFANKSCPGDYLYGKMGEIAEEVNRWMGASSYPEESGTADLDEKPAANPNPIVSVGDSVMITGNQYSTGQIVPLWAKRVPHVVSRVEGGKALLGEVGGIRSWVGVGELTVM